MQLNDYIKEFDENLKIMSRTATGVLDVSASATKKDSMMISDGDKAKEIVRENIDKAVRFLYENKNREFNSADDLGNFIIQLAQITNEGIVKSDSLFRNGADSTKYNYVLIKDIPEVWKWFTRTLLWLMVSDSFEVYEVAAFCEIVINGKGHFFSDGCGKISMLMGLYIFMRNDMPGVKYLSRNEYFEIMEGRSVPSPEDLKHIFADEDFNNFLYYYGGLCVHNYRTLKLYYKKENEVSYVIALKGVISNETFPMLDNYMQNFYENHPEAEVVFDCSHLVALCSVGARWFAGIFSSGKKITFRNVEYDCEISLLVEKLGQCVENPRNIRTIDVNDDMILSQGFNGKIYKINGEIVAKTFKKESYYDDMKRERNLLRNALICGVAAPISFGYAIVHGEVALLMELITSGTYLDMLLKEEPNYSEHLSEYVSLVNDLHGERPESIFDYFPFSTYEKTVLEKADKLDEYVDSRLRGKARIILETIDEPYGLLHGDIQPGNVMFNGEEMIFIDFDSFCIDKPIYDYAALFLTLFMEDMVGLTDKKMLLLSHDKAEKFWNEFIDRIYKGESEDFIEKKLNLIKMIAAIRYTWLEKKRHPGTPIFDHCVNQLNICIVQCLEDAGLI